MWPAQEFICRKQGASRDRSIEARARCRGGSRAGRHRHRHRRIVSAGICCSCSPSVARAHSMRRRKLPAGLLPSSHSCHMHAWSLPRRARRARSIRKTQSPHHVDPCRFYPSEPVEKWCDPSTYCSTIRPLFDRRKRTFWHHPIDDPSMYSGMQQRASDSRKQQLSWIEKEGEVAVHVRSIFSVIGRHHALATTQLPCMMKFTQLPA